MLDNHQVLIAVGEDDASHRAVQYVASLLGSNPSMQVHLLHVLPPIPPGLLEFGGRSEGDAERRAEADLDRETAGWHAQAEDEATPLLDHFRGALLAAGLPPERVTVKFVAPLPEEDVRGRILAAASELRCGTIVVGHSALPWYAELVHSHVCKQLLPRDHDHALWVIP